MSRLELQKKRNENPAAVPHSLSLRYADVSLFPHLNR